jgi:hypothetical protein
VEEIVREIESSPWRTNLGDEWLKFGAFKVTLDGGQSVGTAYQRMPYGPFGRQLYGQTNPDARGTLFVEPGKLLAIMRAARNKGWSLTAHAQGGGAIDTLLDVFEALDQEKPIAPTRSHVMHGSMQDAASLDRMKRLGIAADVQPGWLHFDAPALERVFGERNLRWFFPIRAYLDRGIPAAGGSDHMLFHDKNRAVNPYNPFFGMWMTITRRTTEGKVLYPEERVTRQEAIRMWTTWAAWLQFSEKEQGSIEPGKLADLVVIDRDILTCPEDEIRAIEPLMVVLGGKIVERRIPAFPGAEGAGALTPGGRGGSGRSGSGRIIDSTRQVGGWPAYPPAEAPLDSDGDGMPDLWERRHGLNPHDSTDAAAGWNGDGYTNIEEYLNALADGTARVEDFLQGQGNTHAVSASTRSGNYFEPRHRFH